MSELIAEARVLVTPDTTAFRALLVSQVTTAAAGVSVPIQVTPVISGGGTAAATAGITAAQQQLAVATQQATGALRLEQLLVAQGAADLSQFAQGTDLAATSSREMEGALKRQNKALADHRRQLGGLASGASSAGLSLVGLRGATLAASAPFLAGAAAAIAFTSALKTFAGFEEQLNVLQASTGATADEMQRVSQVARQLGADVRLPGVSAADAAVAMTEFAKAGLTINEAIAATPGGLQLAAAAQLDYASAVNLTAGALNAFDLAGNQAVHVADVLANASNLAQGGIGDMALALRQAAGAAAVVGVSFEETSALLTLLARNGLVGSDAGTALRTAFLRLVNPSKEANKVLEQLGVNLRDIQGNVRPEVFSEFAEAQKNLSAAQQQANAAIVFGQDAFRAFGFLGREGAAGLQEVTVALEKQGSAAQLAAARSKGLSGEARGLSSNLETLGLTLGEIVAPAAESFVGGLNRIVGGLNKGAEAARGFLDSADFSAADANLKELTARLDQLDTDMAEATKAGREFQAEISSNEAAQLADQIAKIGKELTDTPRGFQRVQAAFSEGSPVIAAALQDGIITPLEQAELATSSLGRAFLKTFKLDVVGSINTALQTALGGLKARFEDLGEEAAKSFGVGFASASSQLNLDLAVARAGGDEGEELSILRERETRQAAFLEAVLDRPQTQKNVDLATKAAQNLDATRSQIAAILAQQQSAAKAASDKVVQDASAADRTFLEGLAAARENQENAISRALITEGTKDDIRETKELRALIQTQINQIRARVGDEKTKQAAIRALTAAKIATTASITNLTKAAKDENEKSALEIAGERLSLRVQIAETRENDNAALLALNKQIANQRKQVKAAKTLDEQLQEQLILEQLLAKRREALNKEREQSTQGTTAFDLLTDAAQRFTSSAGNLIGANQPFAGPTEFTADLSQFLRRSNTTTAVVAAKQSPFAGFQGSADRLVEAINRNTAALNGGEEGPTVRKGKRPPVSGAIQRNDQRWVNTAQARETVEGAGG